MSNPATQCPRVRGVALAVVLGLLGPAPAAQGGIEWQTDLPAARAQAQRTNKPLFVLVHQAGEPGNDDMLATVYRHERFVRALAGVVPVLVCRFAPEQAERVAAAFGRPAEELARAEPSLRAALFGTEEMLTPQHLLLHPDGHVLWHGIRACSLQLLLRGIEAARAALPQSAAQRRRAAVAQVADLVRRAGREEEAYARLVTLLRHAPEEDLGALLAPIAVHSPLCARVVRDATRGVDLARGRRVLDHGLALAKASARPALDQVLAELEALAAPAPAVEATASLPAPLPILGRIASLPAVRFGDGVERDASDPNASLTVLWLFLPDDPQLARQIEALRPVVAELTRAGVRFLGLGAALDPEAHRDAVGAAGFPFAAGVYRYAPSQPFEGVDAFPAAIVLDRHGNVLYRTSAAEMSASWVGFAAVVRGILASPHST